MQKGKLRPKLHSVVSSRPLLGILFEGLNRGIAALKIKRSAFICSSISTVYQSHFGCGVKTPLSVVILVFLQSLIIANYQKSVPFRIVFVAKRTDFRLTIGPRKWCKRTTKSFIRCILVNILDFNRFIDWLILIIYYRIIFVAKTISINHQTIQGCSFAIYSCIFWTSVIPILLSMGNVC